MAAGRQSVVVANEPRLRALDGLRFFCHVWVVAVHCLPSLSFWDGYMRNLDAGSFFVITGLTTHLSLCRSLKRKSEEVSRGWIIQRWLIKRIVMMVILGLLFVLGSWLIFPIAGASRSDLLFSLLTFTYPFIQHFDRERENWNPNPPIWFIHICIWLWIFHPLIYLIKINISEKYFTATNTTTSGGGGVTTSGDTTTPATTPTIELSSSEFDDDLTPIPKSPGGQKGMSSEEESLWLGKIAATDNHHTAPASLDLVVAIISFLSLLGCMLVLLGLEYRNSTIYNGWSYHWVPRSLQYSFGVWSATVVQSEDLKLLITDPVSWLSQRSSSGGCFMRGLNSLASKFCALKIIVRFMPDLIFVAIVTINSLKPHRFDHDWPMYWMPRALIVTPLEALLTVSFLYSEYMTEDKADNVAMVDDKKLSSSSEVNIEMNTELSISKTPKMRVFAHFKKRVLKNHYSIITSIWSSSWYRDVAPGRTNTVTYLLHFPMSWQPLYDKNVMMQGHKSLMFLLPLWWVSLGLDKGLELLGNCLNI